MRRVPGRRMSEFLGAEVWRGGVNNWQCDEMGHLNVRFYVALAEEGLALLMAELGLGHAFSPQAQSTVIFREQHIRFLREAHGGSTLFMTAGLLEMGESDARVLIVLRHTRSGQPCASFVCRVSHVTARDLRPFAWPVSAREKAAALTVGSVPDFAAPRSIALDAFETTASLERAETNGMVRLARGMILPEDADAFGRMTSRTFIGRISDGITVVVAEFRETVVKHAAQPVARFGGAVLEQRLVFLRWPRVGDRFEIRTGANMVDARVQGLIHWMLDPASGEPWAVAEARVVTFDLDARKIVPVSEAAQTFLRTRMPADLAL